MKVYHISAENDQDAAMGTIDALKGIQAVGGTVTAAFNFESDPNVPSVIVAILPAEVDPTPFFEGRSITHVADIIDLPKEETAVDNQAEAERDSSGEDRGDEGAGEGADSEEAAS